MFWLLLGACAQLPRTSPDRPHEAAPHCGADTPLATFATRTPAAGTTDSDIALLDTGRQALLWRVALIEAATCSIDAQYYIWNSDDSGRYVAARLLAAADRGVRVRLLLDDINVAGRDGVLAALDRHPNVSIRIYNPAAERTGLARSVSLLRDFTRINRRMHNKSLTVDRVATVLGGRNIGDEYFDADPVMNFRDRDVAVIGPVAAETVDMFDAFWNSPLALPVTTLTGHPERDPMADDDLVEASRVEKATGRMNYLHGPLPVGMAGGLDWLDRALPQTTRAPAHLVYDPPPALDTLGDTDTLQPSSAALRDLAEHAEREILIESAYLVVDDATLGYVDTFHDRGVRIRVLTNSLASNDVTANHAAYARRRTAILGSGVDLYEFRPDAESCRRLVENHAPCVQPQIFGLHSKSFVLDRRTVYVGSLNMNLRSHYLNAESGLIIESPELADRIARDIEENMLPGNSWQPRLDRRGRLRWIEDHGAAAPTVVYDHEPRTSWTRRVVSAAIAALPIEKYL
ncbi:MAG: phospholipase D family protein [Pseudomonadales bacterium]|nr:phospholipase D family protein [Pseudomonadales bacterium]